MGSYREVGRVLKRFVAASLLALMMVPFAGSAAFATDKVQCLFYQTFRERDPGDCIL